MAERDGKMAFMNAIVASAVVELDGSGRIVVPKKVRDALRLGKRERLLMECDGESFKVSRETRGRGLFLDKGLLVFDSGGPVLTQERVQETLDQVRKEREERILGLTQDR